MKVLADFHHGDLFYSLQLLFEKRLGWELYRPVGLDWYREGYWKVFDHVDTARQFLDIGGSFEDLKGKYPDAFFVPLNAGAKEVSSGTFLVPDVTKDSVQRGITLQEFKETKFDIVISSIPDHIPLYNQLIERFQPQAKHIFQVGNAWGHQPGVRNILASTAPFPVPAGINACFYHQEFDLETYRYEPPDREEQKKVHSYIHWMNRRELFGEYAIALPEFAFRSFGAGMDDSIIRTADVAGKMRESAFTWHYKPEGDGFGHSVFGTCAVGRPPLIWGSQYQGKLAGHLFTNEKTCLNLEGYSKEDNLRRIRQFARPEEHLKMCEATARRFRNVVDFDEEEKRIRTFLSRLV